MDGKPWDRRPDESEQAYASALLYFELGTGRSIAAVAEKQRGSQGGPKGVPRKQTGRLKLWCSKYKWVERAAAYDAYQSNARHEAQTEVVRARARTDAEIAAERKSQFKSNNWHVYIESWNGFVVNSKAGMTPEQRKMNQENYLRVLPVGREAFEEDLPRMNADEPTPVRAALLDTPAAAAALAAARAASLEPPRDEPKE